MNAPIRPPLGDSRAPLTTPSDDGIVTGVARHVSADGCQVLLTAGSASALHRMMLSMPSGGLVGGTIRWVLADRLGFAFDAAIDAQALAELAGQGAQPNAVQLLPVARPASSE